MKILFAAAVLCVSLGNATPSNTEPVFNKEKNEKEKKEGDKKSEEKPAHNKNLHSVKKWKMTIEYTNGSVISKTFVVNKNSDLSALETAFKEAGRYLKNIKNIKDYSISPVTNSYVLLAGD